MGDPRNHGPTSSRFLYVFFQYHWANSSRWQRMPRPRWALRLEAFAWRNLMDLGMFLHRLHSPRPLSPSFRRSIPVTVSPRRELSICYSTPLETIRNAIAITYPRGILSWQTSTAVDTRLVRLVMMLVGLLQSWKLWRPWSSALSIAWHRSTPSLQLSRMVLTP